MQEGRSEGFVNVYLELGENDHWALTLGFGKFAIKPPRSLSLSPSASITNLLIIEKKKGYMDWDFVQ